MIEGSIRLFTFARSRAGLPARACSASLRTIAPRLQQTRERGHADGEKVLAQAERRENDVVEALRPGVAGQKIEQLGQVPAKSFSASEKTEIAVYARSARVVISRRQMAVAPDAVGFLAHHQTHFAVGVVSTRP
jgi:hypothetical protein